MEALTFGADAGSTYVYIGDEYNYMYQMQISDGSLTRQWNLATDLAYSTNTDKGVESLTYASSTGYYYAGIQDLSKILVFSIDPACSGTACTATKISEFPTLYAPSGLFYYAAQNALYVMCGTMTNGDQYLLKYSLTGNHECLVTIPAAVGMSRTDGFFIDSASTYAYIADSQVTRTQVLHPLI